MITADELIRTEEGFENIILEQIEPYLASIGKFGTFKSFDGTKIAYSAYVNPNAVAEVMLIHGFGEFAGKYNEMIYMLYTKGYSVYITDLRCHGYSDRFVDDMSLVDVHSFDEYVEDIKRYYDIEIKASSLPKYLIGHSMGGAIAILYTEKYPEDFSRVVFSSPMVRMRTGKVPFEAVKMIAKCKQLVGKGQDYVVGKGPFNPESRLNSSSCKSPERYEYIMNKRRNDVINQTWSGSYNWVYAACKASDKLIRSKRVKRITMPVLVLRAGCDHLVDSERIEKFATMLPNAKYAYFPEARHEIYHGLEEERVRFYDEILEFLEE